jgi:hypothetical protein
VTGTLDEIGTAVLKRHGARSAPQIVYGCPGVNLISVNDEIVHGLPGKRRLRPGDRLDLVECEAGDCPFERLIDHLAAERLGQVVDRAMLLDPQNR